MWDDPLVGFADVDDPIFTEYKTIISPEHLTPREALAKACDKAPGELPARLSVISYILPAVEETRRSNRAESRVPSRLWSIPAGMGRSSMTSCGPTSSHCSRVWGTWPPRHSRSPTSRRTVTKKDLTPIGRNGMWPMLPALGPSASRMASSLTVVSPSAAAVWSPVWRCQPDPGRLPVPTPTVCSTQGSTVEPALIDALPAP